MTTERFLTLADVSEILNISASQAYALVRSGDLQGIQIGGRNQWRVERANWRNTSGAPTDVPPLRWRISTSPRLGAEVA